MKRYGMFFVVTSILLVFICASASFAIFPGKNGAIGDGLVSVQLLHGWWSPVPVPALGNPTPAWYSSFASNNIRTAQTEDLTLSQKLTNEPLTARPVVYVVTNFNNDGPVFSASPHPLGDALYTGLWTVVYITWLPTATPHVITNSFLETVANPTGLPLITEANYTTSIPGTPLGVVPIPPAFVGLGAGPFTIVDYPIFATGPLTSPFFKPTNLAYPYTYRIGMGRSVNTLSKLLTIPFWYVYCRNDVTRAIHVERAILPDSSDVAIVQAIGANFAPLLSTAPWTPPQPSPAGGTSTVYVINPFQVIPGTFLKVLADQYPVMDACPTSTNWLNSNRNYSPVFAAVLLNRNLGLISPEILFNNWEFTVQEILAGALVPVPAGVYPPVTPGVRVNAPVL